MHTADRHVAKRPFQPSITSYFLPNTDHGRDSTHQPRERLAPEVPGQIQAGLLSVGMRVRKSVPEGYKTANKMTFPPPISQHTTRPRASSISPHMNHPRDAVPEEAIHQRELLPFCGLLKIGGFAEQPTTNPHLYAGRDASGNRATNFFPLPAEAFSQPFSSSQDSGFASDPAPRNPHNPSKRSWQDDDERRPSTNFFFAIPKGSPEIDDVPVSPLSEAPSANSPPAVRPIAYPKSRRPQVLRTGSEDSMDTDAAFEDEARVEGTIGAGSGSDFEDADFLHDNEVTMGGV